MSIRAKEYSFKEVVNILNENGYVFKRNGKGDHKIYSDGKTTISIPCAGKSVNRMMFNRLVKENGLAI